MEVKIRNRYNDEISFVVNEDNKFIIMKGAKYTRSGFCSESGKRTFVDPGGGPFIGQGMDLTEIDNQLKGFIVSTIVRGVEDEWILRYEHES
jgi:hypothetical protein